jgi:prepilin-type N-terminal cleavage/methylation domain-containing protein
MRNERGFTLVEMLVATAIAGILSIALVGTVFQVTTVAVNGTDKLAAANDIQNAVHQINRDGHMASAAVGGNSLTLTYPSASEVVYSLVGDELLRTASGSDTVVAGGTASASFSVVDRNITVTLIQSEGGGEPVVFQVQMRLSG